MHLQAYVALAGAFLTAYVGVVGGCNRPFYGSSCSERCGAILKGSLGTIRSPGYETLDSLYANQERCDWYIDPQIENSSVLITFELMDTESCCDHLSVFGDLPTYSTLVAQYSGNRLPYQVLLEGPLRLYFESNDSDRRKGFVLHYQVIPGVAPKFVSVTKDTTVKNGDEVLLPCRVTGVPVPVVTWYKNGTEVHSALQSNFTVRGTDLIIKNIREEDAGLFKCKVQNHLSSVEQVFQLRVYVAPVITAHPTAVHLENIFDSSHKEFHQYSRSIAAVFRCEAHGVPRPIIHWLKDGQILPKSRTVSGWLVIRRVTTDDIAHYSCFANNTVGSAESRSAPLTIGNALTSKVNLRTHIRLPFYSTEIPTANTEPIRIRLNFYYNSYVVSNVTVTRDGYPFFRYQYNSTSGRYIILERLDTTDSGVYGWHIYLSSSNATFLTTPIISTYTALIIYEPPSVTVTPRSPIVRDLSGQLDIACSAQPVYYSTKILWFKNSSRIHDYDTIEGDGQTRSYLRVRRTSENIGLTNYTCMAQNKYGLIGRAMVSVLLRVDTGGWGWWSKTSQCSRTCGRHPGIQVWIRRCFSTRRCRGSNIDYRPCLPPLSSCFSESGIMQNPPTAIAELNKTQSTFLQNPEPTARCEKRKAAEKSYEGYSLTFIGVSVLLTGVVTAVLTGSVTYRLVSRTSRRKEDRPRQTAIALRTLSVSVAESERHVASDVIQNSQDVCCHESSTSTLENTAIDNV